MNVSEVIVKVLESIGVDTLFTGSGQGSGELMFAFHDSKKIRTILVKNEQAASFMACGYAMFSDKLGVFTGQGGPGAFNFLSGLAVAYSDSLPIMSIASFAPKNWRGLGDLGETTGLNRTPNGPQIYAATTKKYFIIEDPKQTIDIIEDAINVAFEGRPGPVHIDLPYDVARLEGPALREIKFTIKQVLPSLKKVKQFAGVLENAIKSGKKILAILGYGIVRSHAEKEVLNFLKKFQVPFVTTMDGKGLLPEDHPLSLGITGISADPGAKQAFKAADVVLAIGNSFAKWSTWKFQEDLFDDKVLLHINIDKKEIDKVYTADYSMVSDVKPAIAAITEALSQKITSVDKANLIIQKHYHENIQYTGNKIHPGKFVQELSKLLPENSIILGDAGSHMIWLSAYLQLNKGQNYQNPGSFGPMASHVNAAIGVQLANPDRRVIVGCGDGDYLMSGFELMTAVENKIPIVWIIFDNGEFNIIKLFHLGARGESVMNEFKNPDFVKYAEACGANGYRIERLVDFAKAFKEALKSDKPTLIDVVIDPEPAIPFKMYNEN
jgi:acetolactate synthase-1/2/3 large subunit